MATNKATAKNKVEETKVEAAEVIDAEAEVAKYGYDLNPQEGR